METHVSLEGTVQGKAATLRLVGQTLEVILNKKETWLQVPVELVLDVSWKSPHLLISLLAPKRHSEHASRILTRDQWAQRHANKHVASLSLFQFRAHTYDGSSWANTVMTKAYDRTPARRRVLVICNPSSGKGHAKHVLEDVTKPIFQAARFELDVVETTARGDAFRFCTTLDVSRYDIMAFVGGDGTLHEAINGLASRNDAVRALSIPLVPIPAGSGNGLYVSLHGAEIGFSAPVACLTAIKGVPYSHELMAVTQPLDAFGSSGRWPYTLRKTTKDGRGYVQFYSFMSQAIGIMADIDIGTEAWRFIGDIRFTLGYVFAVLRNKACPIHVDAYFGASGTASHASMYECARQTPVRVLQRNGQLQHSSAIFHHEQMQPHTHMGTTKDLPADVHRLRFGTVLDELPMSPTPFDPTSASHPPSDVWTRIHTAVSTVYTGKVPYVARSLLAFPYTCPDDGLFDVLLQEQRSSAMKKILATTRGETGDHIFDHGMDYFKVEALRITPYENAMKKNARHYISIDGESVPYAPFQVEVSPLHVSLLTLSDDEWLAPSIRARTIDSHASRYASTATSPDS